MAKQIESRTSYETSINVPFMDLKSEHSRLGNDFRKVWDELLDTAAFVGGPQIERFEKAFAAFCEVNYATGVANGTDALILGLKALGIGQGDEVITAVNSFVATAEAIVHCGAQPVFADIDAATYNIDANQIERLITRRTKAIIPVHLYGQPADMQPILEIAKKHNLRVVEDASQAHGATYKCRRVGSLGDVGCFSFYPAKNIGACGDAGAVVTNDPDIAAAVRKLRDHGGLKKYEHDVIGYNSRLDSLQAAILTIKLNYLELRNEMRRRHADVYNDLLSRIPGIVTPSIREEVRSVYHLYVIRVEKGNRNHLQEHLKDCGIQTGIHYPTPIPDVPAFRRFKSHGFPVAESCAEQILSLPMYPELERDQMEYVADRVANYMESKWSTLA